MVATTAACSPPLRNPLLAITSFRGLLEHVPAQLGLVSEYGDEEYYVWTNVTETKGLPGIHDAPTLESDMRRRRRAMIRFTRADNDHPLAHSQPLAVHDLAQPVICAPTPATAVAKFSKRRRSTVSAERVVQSGCEPQCVNESDDELDCTEEVEMTTWRQRHVPMRPSPDHSVLQAPRLNRDFLRMYIAQRLMYEHGKIKEISCSVLLPPRPRPSLKPQCTLGVRHSWNKTYRRREWTAWRPSELVH